MAIVAVIVVGFVVFRDRLPGAASDLNVGECFDRPSTTDDIGDVPRQPCNEPHDAEVFLNVDHPAAAGEVYPISLTMDRFVMEQCTPAFNTYTGLDFETSVDYDIGYLQPTRQGWNEGDREVTCYIVRSDDAKMNASLRAATP